MDSGKRNWEINHIKSTFVSNQPSLALYLYDNLKRGLSSHICFHLNKLYIAASKMLATKIAMVDGESFFFLM